MATIEPRLMHLLNNPNASPSSDSSAYYPPTELPPLQSFSSFAKASNISLPPLEPDAGSSHHEKPPSNKTIRQIPSLASIREEYNTGRYSHDGGSERSRQQHSGGISLRMLFDNPEINESSHSLNHILDDIPEPTVSADDGSNKKRHRAMTVKDDIMHLPQPLKKQKSTQNMMSSQNIMPPIINGLYEPPPNAAVFPPISLEDDPSNSNETVAPSNMHTLKEFASAPSMSTLNNAEAFDVHEKSQSPPRRESLAPTPEAEKPMAKIKRKAAKPRKKWSEEETRDLLLGVNRYGVGKWTSILEDPQYKFNGRTAGDLKDRFRTCCPDELRIVPSKSKESLHSPDKGASSPAEYRPKTKSKTALLLEDILADPEEASNYHVRDDAAYTASQAAQQSQHDSDSTTKPKKSRAHRKKIEDLQAMGIHGPFKKSHRRERRPFTQQDDDQILEGLQLYGPAWTKIQRDPRFDLSSRQPTDLRDRVRNKYPEMYKQIEEKQAPTTATKEATPSAPPGPASSHPPLPTRQAPRRDNVLEPSVSNMINENSLMTLEPHLHRSGSREDLMMPKWAGPSTSGANAGSGGGSFHELPGMDSFTREALDGEGVEVGEQPGASAAFIGMMDISRLLLDG